MTCPVCNSPKYRIFSSPDFHYTFPDLSTYHICDHCHHQYVVNVSPEELLQYYSSDSYYSKNLSPVSHLSIFKLLVLIRRICDNPFLSPFTFLFNFLPPRFNIESLFIHLLGQKKISSSIELGCGSGRFVKLLRAFSFNSSGYDINTNNPHENIFSSNLDTIASLPQSDSFYSSHTFEHLSNPFSLLRLVHESLADDGIFLLIVPNISSLSFRMLRNFWYFNGVPWHLHGFSTDSLKLSLQAAGFTRISISSAYDFASLLKTLKFIITNGAPFITLIRYTILLLLSPLFAIIRPREGDHLIAYCTK